MASPDALTQALSAVHSPADAAQIHVDVRGVSKTFGGTRALRNVSVSILRGTVHALVGENGAGKSTLGKIMSGVIQPDADSGQIVVNGAAVSFGSPHDALANGITILSQEVALVPRLTVLENVFLGIESTRAGIVRNDRETRRRFDELIERSGFRLEAGERVGGLRLAEQKQVEILKAMARKAQLIVMDEPTAALPETETAKLLELVRRLRAMGTTVVFVSHFLEEVLSVADTVTVLRDGQHIQTVPAAESTPESLVTAMLGRAMSLNFPPKRYPPPDAPVVVSVRNLTAGGAVGGASDISFNLRAGEIVGLAGLVGSGRTAVAKAIFGAIPRDSGAIEVDGVPVRIQSPTDAVKAGIAMLPESRKREGLLLNQPLRTNVTLPHLDAISQSLVIRQGEERRETGALLRNLDVRPLNAEARVSSLSGGNQQKVLFGKWLFRYPRLLIADEPTHGVDVGAKRAIYELIGKLAAEGMTILLISSELEEILGLAHRVLVMRQGSLVAEFAERPDEGRLLSEDEIMRAAFATAYTTPFANHASGNGVPDANDASAVQASAPDAP